MGFLQKVGNAVMNDVVNPTVSATKESVSLAKTATKEAAKGNVKASVTAAAGSASRMVQASTGAKATAAIVANNTPHGQKTTVKRPNPKTGVQEEVPKAQFDKERAAKDTYALNEKTRKESSQGAVDDVTKALKEAAGGIKALGDDTTKQVKGIQANQDQATEDYKKFLDDKSKLIDEKAKNIEQLSKWHQGIVTSYEEIAQRYKDGITGLDKGERQGMETKAKQDYMAMSGLGAQAAGIGMGPMATGSQQQLMGAMFQQQATSAYSNAQKNISSVDEQRRLMQFNVVQGASGDERANRQLGFNMETSQIQQGMGAIKDSAGMAGMAYGAQMGNFNSQRDTAMTGYGLGLNTIQAQTAGNTYGPQARLALNNAQAATALQNQALSIQRDALNRSGNINPIAAAGTGAMAGGMVAGPWGAAAGAGAGLVGSYMVNK